MTTLEGRPNTALLVIDVQNDVVAGRVGPRRRHRPHQRPRRQGPRRARPGHLGAALRRRHAGRDSDGWQYVPELTRDESEPLVHKRYGDSFEDTDLEAVLAERQVGRVVVTGAQTDACIRSTLHGALVRGYDTTLVEDAHTTEDLRQWGVPVSPEQVIAHTNVSWSWSEAPGRTGDVVPTADIDFGAR